MSDETRPMIIYHNNCNDGFTAAWVASLALGEDCDFFPANYGQPPPDISGRKTYILDFSYKRPIMLELASKTRDLTVLDHHKTAASELEGLAEECIRAYGLIPPKVVFDMDKSGARLAWEHFFPDELEPWIVQYVEDRDLWAWKLPYSREVNSALASYPRTFANWNAHHTNPHALGSMIVEGGAIERYRQNLIETILKYAAEVEIDGYKVLAVNTTVEISEVGGKLAEGRPFGATWFYQRDGKKQWSLRSRDGGIDVSEIARRRGGGGHRNAAGFQGEIAKADGPAVGGA